MKLIIDISKDRYNEIMAKDWKNCRRFFDEEIRAIHDGIPQRTGRWISFGTQGEIDGQIVRKFTCSECGAISIFRVSNGNIVNGNLCPNCGAKMIEPQEGDG